MARPTKPWTDEDEQARDRFRAAYREAMGKASAGKIAEMMGVSRELIRKMATETGSDKRRVGNHQVLQMEAIARML